MSGYNRFDPLGDREFRRRTAGMSPAQIRAVHAADDAERRREEEEAKRRQEEAAAEQAERRWREAEDYVEGDAGTRAASMDAFFQHGRGAR